jgi:putative zinc finger protein
MSDVHHSHPSLEEVAAFAEGRLRGAERDRVVEHMAGCNDCRELLADVLVTWEALEAEEGSAAPVDFAPAAQRRAPRWVRPLAAVAAMVTVAVGAGLYWNTLRQTPPSRQDFLAQMPPADQVVPNIWGGVVMRGEGDPGEIDRQSAEIGALLVDLDVAAAGGAAGRAAELMRRIATIFDQAATMEDEVAILRSLAQESDIQRMRAVLAKELPEIEAHARERFTTFYLDLGAFAEEARLAALAGNSSFLESRRNRSYLSWVLGQQKEELPPTVRESLALLASSSGTPVSQAEAAAAILRTLTL